MEFMCKSQIIESLLKKILQTVERILANSETITSPSFYLLTPSGMERLESTCMLLIAIGEGVKGVDKLTDKKLLSFYPGMDWKGVMGMRDIIAHHYFDLDAEIVYDVIKHDLPKLKDVLQQIVDDLKVSNQAIDLMFFYLKFLKYARTFRIILIPITTPSNTAIPVLNERMIASALLVAGASGANISRVVAVMAFF